MLLLLLAAAPANSAAQGRPEFLGRWDVTVHDGATDFPSWLEFKDSGQSIVGGYVAQFGSVRPIGKVEYNRGSGRFRFVVPPQFEKRTNDVVYEGALEGDVLRGETTNEQGKMVKWEGHRAPKLVRDHAPKWGKPVKLFNGRDLSGWKTRHPNLPNGWRVENGGMTNAAPGNDIMTEQQFSDFKLRAQFRYPKGSNSGIYLRGRHEVQIEDDYGRDPDSHLIGGVYGFLSPRVIAAKPAGEWQTIEITLIGRLITVVLNGDAVIERQAIPGITGGALDSDEGKPGPIMIQGDHGRVEFKEITITPAE